MNFKEVLGGLAIILKLLWLPSCGCFCRDPVASIVTGLVEFEWDKSPAITVLYSDEMGLGGVQSLKNFQELSVSVVPASGWDESLTWIYKRNHTESHSFPVTVILPKDGNSSKQFLSSISNYEAQQRGLRKTLSRTFIVWPESCPEDNFLQPGCYTDEVPEKGQMLSSVPQISSEIYILVCEKDGGTNDSTPEAWSVMTLNQMGRGTRLAVKRREWTDVFNHYTYNWDFQGGQINAIFRPESNSERSQEMVYHTDSETGSIVVTGGVMGNIFNYLEEALNATIQYNTTVGWRNVSGVAQQVTSGQADIVAEKVTYLPERRKTLHTVVPVYAQGLHMFFQQPPASSIRDIFVQPFQKDLWMTLVAVWVLVTIASMIAAKIKSTFSEIDETDDEISKDSVLWAIGFTCQQGWHVDPESVYMKIIFLCASALGLIIYVAYSAALVSALSEVVVPIKSFQDLLSSSLPIATDPGSSTINFILDGDDVKSQISRKRLQVPTVEIGVGKALDSETAMMIFPDLFFSIAKNQFKKDDGYLCETVTSLPVNTVPFKSGTYMTKGSPFAEFINFRLVTMFENGLLYRMVKHYIRTFKGGCELATVRMDVSLALHDVFTAFAIMGVGYVLSLTILVLEKLYSMSDRTRRLETPVSTFTTYSDYM